ncbi:MAG TPA: MBL fold metallo-hydrolase, partial [Hyphomicrobiaceae bacterium]|nr:MBL fold metallo-hydrolase [Hyphomicrobiaceae bacterium]
TGSSGGVPRVGNDWGACSPENPRNRRRRCSALLERFEGGRATRVLIDTSPDLREQALTHRIEHLDAVLYTHDHADHTHGIDDLRFISYRMKRRINVYLDQPTRVSLEGRFGYCFSTPPGSAYPPIVRAHEIEAGTPITVTGAGGAVEALPVPQEHGDIPSLGFRIGNLAYSPDISGLSDGAADMLLGLDVWIVDALRYIPHPSHWSVKQSLEWIERLAPKRAILTHLHIDLDYDALKRELPAHVEPAYDGMVIDFR